MSALTDFLLARIAELEALAQRAAQEFEDVGVGTPPTWGRRQWEFRVDRRNPALVDYLVAQSPARVLARCASDRRIVELRPAEAMRMGDVLESMAGEVDGEWESIGDDLTFHITRQEYLRHREILCLLAAPHADHPDFDPGWAL